MAELVSSEASLLVDGHLFPVSPPSLLSVSVSFFFISLQSTLKPPFYVFKDSHIQIQSYFEILGGQDFNR